MTSKRSHRILLSLLLASMANTAAADTKEMKNSSDIADLEFAEIPVAADISEPPLLPTPQPLVTEAGPIPDLQLRQDIHQFPKLATLIPNTTTPKASVMGESGNADMEDAEVFAQEQIAPA